MPFKLENYWLKVCVSYASLIFGLGSASAFATVTVTPPTPYEVNQNTVYFASKDSTGGPIVDSGYTAFDFSQTAASETDGNRPNMLRFEVSSDKSFSLSGSQVMVVTVYAATTNGGSPKPVPIARVGDVDCVDQGRCQHTKTETDSYNYLYAAKYGIRERITIGIYPEDICNAVYAQSSTTPATGCTGGDLKDIIPGSPAVFNLTFYVSIAQDARSLGATDSNADSLQFSVVLQEGAPSITCPDFTQTEPYFPGDKEILVDSSKFTFASDTGHAPVNALMVIGAKDKQVDLSTSFLSTNQVFGRLKIGTGVTNPQPVTGFENKTATANPVYEIAYSARDLAGVVAPLKAPDCVVSGVQTSTVQGFLSKSDCFIASAAYQSPTAAPVQLLRQFRGDVLMRFAFGRDFVHWYYRHSPKAAAWLLENSEFRYPVIAVLTPIVGIAWLILHPLVLALGLVGAMLVAALVRRMRRVAL